MTEQYTVESDAGQTIYQVEADYPLHRGGSWTWRRRYFSKQAALRQAERRRMGWTHEAIQWDEDDVVVEPALAVRVSAASVGAWCPIPPAVTEDGAR